MQGEASWVVPSFNGARSHAVSKYCLYCLIKREFRLWSGKLKSGSAVFKVSDHGCAHEWKERGISYTFKCYRFSGEFRCTKQPLYCSNTHVSTHEHFCGLLQTAGLQNVVAGPATLWATYDCGCFTMNPAEVCILPRPSRAFVLFMIYTTSSRQPMQPLCKLHHLCSSRLQGRKEVYTMTSNCYLQYTYTWLWYTR